jgi:hypothetical protein
MKLMILIHALFSAALADTPEYTPQTGDVIAHTSKSSQSVMIQVGTMSKYSHVGVIFVGSRGAYVFESVATTRMTPLDDFISRGKNGKYTILRYEDEASESQGLTDEQKNSLWGARRPYLGKRYDLAFKWSDDKMYCSESTWKIFRDIGIDLTETRKIRSFNIWIPKIRKVMEARWGGPVNMDEPVVAPKDVVRSDLLNVVYDNY